MLSIAKGANLALMFFLELGVLVSVGYWGFTVSPNWAIKLLAGLGGMALFIGAWALFGAGGGANATFPLTRLATVAPAVPPPRPRALRRGPGRTGRRLRGALRPQRGPPHRLEAGLIMGKHVVVG